MKTLRAAALHAYRAVPSTPPNLHDRGTQRVSAASAVFRELPLCSQPQPLSLVLVSSIWGTGAACPRPQLPLLHPLPPPQPLFILPAPSLPQ
jgi:hypothetical protein